MGGGTIPHGHQHIELSLPKPKPSSSSSSSSATNLKLLVSSICCSHSENNRSMKMELVRGKEEERPIGCLHNHHHVFDSVPSQLEVEDAVASLNNLMQAMSTSCALQQVLGSNDSRILLSQGYRRIYDALQLLQSDPLIKRLVISLSSDKAVWDAVMRNISLQKLQELPNSAECGRPLISDNEEFIIGILNWLLEIIKGKFMELIENFQSLMNDLFQYPKVQKTTSEATELEGRVRSSLLLSIVILLIVILARVQSCNI